MGQVYQLPITQAELGHATGMSTVHVNRTLQEGASSLRIGGAANGEFDATYLHLK